MQCICLKTGRRSIWSVIDLEFQCEVGVEPGGRWGGWGRKPKPD